MVRTPGFHPGNRVSTTRRTTNKTIRRVKMLKPFDARVVVKKPARQEKTESGIFLPDTVNEQTQTAQGIVISVGQGSRNMNTGEYMEIPIKEGDTIIYTKFSATEVEYEGEQYFFVAERDIIAVIQD